MSGTKFNMPYGTGKTTAFRVMCEAFREASAKFFAFSEKQCSCCKWHEDFSGACCNGDSEYRADFTDSDFVCDKWEERENDN